MNIDLMFDEILQLFLRLGNVHRALSDLRLVQGSQEADQALQHRLVRRIVDTWYALDNESGKHSTHVILCICFQHCASLWCYYCKLMKLTPATLTMG